MVYTNSQIIRKDGQCLSHESDYHRKTKYLLSNILLSQYGHNISKIITEEEIGDRRADIFIQLHNKKKIAIEIQNSIMSVKEVKQRTEDYNKRGIYVLWILNGKGIVCAEGKVPIRREVVKLSTLERYLHYLYGGRVYYLNLQENKNQVSLFGLHYTCSLKRKYRNKRFRTKFSYYYIMDQDPIQLGSYNLLCTKFNNALLARFYDKNLVTKVMNQIQAFVSQYPTYNNKKLLRKIRSHFSMYNTSLLYHAILKLIMYNEIDIKKRHIKRSFRKYYSKYQF